MTNQPEESKYKNSWVPLNAVQYNMIFHKGTEAEYQSESEPTKDTPYFALMGELWGVFCKYVGEIWPCYNSSTL